MNVSLRPLVGILVVGLFVLSDSVADAKVARAGDAAVAFTANATGGMQIKGTTSDLAVADDGTTLTITVPLANLDTGISLRNSHTKKYLEVSRYPNAELSVPRAGLQFGGSGDVTANLTLHGQTHKVVIHYDAPKKGGSFAVHGTTRVIMTDYGIAVPSYLGVTVKPEVGLDVAFNAADS